MCRNCANACDPRPPASGWAERRARIVFAAALASLLLAGCGSNPPAAESGAAVESAGAPAEGGAPVEPLAPEAVQQFERAVLHMNAGDLAAAEQAFRELAQAYPTYSGALVNLGILQSKAGRLEEAEKTLLAALERNDANAAAHNQLGIVYRKLGRFADADQSYQRAVQVDPDYALAWLNLGVLCDLYLQQPERALEAFERYLAIAPAPDEKVVAWVAELKRRVGAGADPRAARAQ